MDQNRLSGWLKAVVIGAGICGTVIYFLFFPYFGRDIVKANPEFLLWYWPWLIFLWSTSIPCYAALVFAWQIAGDIGSNNSFCIKNALRLKAIAQLAAFDSALALIGNFAFMFLNMNHPGVFLLAMFIIFAGIIITVIFAALSHLVFKAAKLREESDLTI